VQPRECAINTSVRHDPAPRRQSLHRLHLVRPDRVEVFLVILLVCSVVIMVELGGILESVSSVIAQYGRLCRTRSRVFSPERIAQTASVSRSS